MKFLVRLIVFVLLSSGSLSIAQKPEYGIRVKGERISVSYKGKAHPLRLADEIDAEKITDAKILFAARRGGDLTYLVIDVSGQSKARQDDRQCGAGVEANLIWVKLDRAWKILDSKSVRYESCWSTITNDNYRKTNNSLYIEIDNFREDIRIKLAYDDAAPEKGFETTREVLQEPE